MKIVKIASIGALVGLLLPFFGVAFAQWDLNPAHWPFDARGLVAFLSPMVAIFGAACAAGTAA